MEVDVEPAIVDEGNRGKSDSCLALLTPFVAARYLSRLARPSPFDLPDPGNLKISSATLVFFWVMATTAAASLFSGESVIKYRKRELRQKVKTKEAEQRSGAGITIH